MNEHTAQDTQDFRNLRYIVAPELAKTLGGPLPSDANMTEEEFTALTSCVNYAQYRATCDALKIRRRGNYPGDWWQKMQISGVSLRLLASFDKKQSDFHANAKELTLPLFMKK